MTEAVLPVCSPALRNRFGSDNEVLAASNIRRLNYRGFDEDKPGGLSWQGWFNQARLALNIAQPVSHFNHLAPLYTAAMQGHGIALGWSRLVESALKNGELITLSDQWVPLKYSYYAVAPAQHFQRPAVTKFIAWLRSQRIAP